MAVWGCQAEDGSCETYLSFFTGLWAKEDQPLLSLRATHKPEIQFSHHVHTSESQRRRHKNHTLSICLKADVFQFLAYLTGALGTFEEKIIKLSHSLFEVFPATQEGQFTILEF